MNITSTSKIHLSSDQPLPRILTVPRTPSRRRDFTGGPIGSGDTGKTVLLQ